MLVWAETADLPGGTQIPRGVANLNVYELQDIDLSEREDPNSTFAPLFVVERVSRLPREAIETEGGKKQKAPEVPGPG